MHLIAALPGGGGGVVVCDGSFDVGKSPRNEDIFLIHRLASRRLSAAAAAAPFSFDRCSSLLKFRGTTSRTHSHSPFALH